MKSVVIALLGLLALSRAIQAAEESSVLIITMTPQRGSLPDIVIGYGTAGPALDSSMTISLQIQGRVTRFFVTPGEAVQARQPLLDFAVSQSTLGNYQQAQTALSIARINSARLQQLVQQQLATKDQLTQADKAVADAQTNLDTLTRSGANKPNFAIEAPFEGIVSAISIAQGDTVAQGAPMMTLMRADGLVVSVGIEPAQRLRLKLGDPVRLEPLTSGGEPSDGTVARINGLLNPRTHLVDAEISSGGKLLPGAAFRASITVGHFEGFVVPRDAVLTDAQGEAVYQVAAAKARRVGVTVVGSNARQSVVTGAINPTLPIVVEGNYQLSDGIAVREAPSEESPATAVPATP
ncbi:MAG: efflux RND transporter periplasmic adaptor subunit [Methylocella sp.]